MQYVVEEFDTQRFQEIADILVSPEKLNILVGSKKFEGSEDVDQLADWFDTPYGTEFFSDNLIALMTNPDPVITDKLLGLPPVNNLIPEDFSILEPNETYSSSAHLLQQWDDTDLWYKKDDRFEMPKAIVQLSIFTNDIGFGQNNNLEADIFSLVWNGVQDEFLREFDYMANSANLDFAIAVGYDAVTFQWTGFNDIMPEYVQSSLAKLLEMPDENLEPIFDQIKEDYIISLENNALQESYYLAVDRLYQIFTD